jgi:hypothetical protein
MKVTRLFPTLRERPAAVIGAAVNADTARSRETASRPQAAPTGKACPIGKARRFQGARGSVKLARHDAHQPTL